LDVAAVGLDALAGFFRDQRGCRDPARQALAGEIPVQPEAAGLGFIHQLRASREFEHPIDGVLLGAKGTEIDHGRLGLGDDLDLSSARRVNQEQERINVDFPSWVVESLDREAARIGVTRQSIIKVWLVERLKAEAANKPLNGDAASDAHWRSVSAKHGSNPGVQFRATIGGNLCKPHLNSSKSKL
jgi:hypothetical protein